MGCSEEEEISNKSAVYDYKAYLEIMRDLERCSNVAIALDMLLRLETSALMPLQLYKTLTRTLNKILLDGKHVKVVLNAWARLIINRKAAELIDDLIEAVLLLSSPEESAESVELLFDVYRVYFFKHLKELKDVVGLERICRELSAEYDAFIVNLRGEFKTSKAASDNR